MGLLDRIKGLFGSSDSERAAKARQVADRAAQKAEVKAAEPDASEPSIERARGKAEAKSAEAAQAEAEALSADTTLSAEDLAVSEEATSGHRDGGEVYDLEAESGGDLATASGVRGAADVPGEAEEREPSYVTYTVRDGDTVDEIAAAHGVNVESITSLNGIDPELIYAGQVIRVPTT